MRRMVCRLHLIRLFRNTSPSRVLIVDLSHTNNALIESQLIHQQSSRQVTETRCKRFGYWVVERERQKHVPKSLQVSLANLSTCVKVINYLAVLSAVRGKATVDADASLWTLSSLLDILSVIGFRTVSSHSAAILVIRLVAVSYEME